MQKAHTCFLHYFHAAISNLLSNAISMSPEWMVAKTCLTAVVELCQLPSEAGLCKAGIQRWYYNKKEGKCLTFIYGGCGGNANRFTTKAACEQRCGKGKHRNPTKKGISGTSGI